MKDLYTEALLREIERQDEMEMFQEKSQKLDSSCQHSKELQIRLSASVQAKFISAKF